MNKQYAIISKFYLCNDIVIIKYSYAYFLQNYNKSQRWRSGVAMVLALGR